MSILFLLYNPNLDDPLSGFTADGTMQGLEKIQKDIMKGDTEAILKNHNLDEKDDVFDTAQEAYQGLLQCEWDALTEAANVAWEHTLEQEKWQKEIKREEEQIKEDIWARCKPKQNSTQTPQSRNYAFGRSSLQRGNTVTVSCGQASTLDFVAPNKDTVLSWRQEDALKNAVLSKTDGTEIEEEDMDCTQVPDTFSDFSHTSRDGNSYPVSFSWQPLCVTDSFNTPALRKTFSCV